jgi:dTDP-glucose 4,6-dehydratase
MSRTQHLLVAGGAGFIGSNFVRRQLGANEDLRITVLDKLTYAGNLANLADVEHDPRYRFVRGDITDPVVVDGLAAETTAIVNFAAESHVDRSIDDPDAFIRTDVYGTHVLMEAARRHGHGRYLQVSSDEVYGHVPEGRSRESDPLRPRSPYSASKAAGDLLALSYHTTYDFPVLITRGSNTFGPYQYPEKVIPLFTTNAIDNEPLPLYGDGLQRRDWLFVDDHCDAIATVLRFGRPGRVYNVGAGNEMTNLALTEEILRLLGRPATLVRHVEDRAGHDRRYAVDTAAISELGWQPSVRFDTGLERTVAWYREREDWWRPLKDASYRDYYARQYADRLASGTSAG